VLSDTQGNRMHEYTLVDLIKHFSFYSEESRVGIQMGTITSTILYYFCGVSTVFILMIVGSAESTTLIKLLVRM
jgi:hypothetical protein